MQCAVIRWEAYPSPLFFGSETLRQCDASKLCLGGNFDSCWVPATSYFYIHFSSMTLERRPLKICWRLTYKTYEFSFRWRIYWEIFVSCLCFESINAWTKTKYLYCSLKASSLFSDILGANTCRKKTRKYRPGWFPESSLINGLKLFNFVMKYIFLKWICQTFFLFLWPSHTFLAEWWRHDGGHHNIHNEGGHHNIHNQCWCIDWTLPARGSLLFAPPSTPPFILQNILSYFFTPYVWTYWNLVPLKRSAKSPPSPLLPSCPLIKLGWKVPTVTSYPFFLHILKFMKSKDKKRNSRN